MQQRTRFRLVGLGEILWDDFSKAQKPGSDASGLPDDRKSDRRPGGAPGNFAYIATALGAEGKVVSRVGCDTLGDELLEFLNRRGLNVDAVEIDSTFKTGVVTVELGSAGQPEYVIHANAAWDHLAGEASGREAVASADAICFGTLAQRSERSRTSIGALLRLAPDDALKIFDVNLRQTYFTRDVIEQSIRLANVVKVNDSELEILAGLFELRHASDRDRLLELATRFDLRTVALTRGEKGSLLYSDGRWSEHAGIRVNVADTVGAGDAFTAALALGLLATWPLDEINRRASEIAAYVCTQPGGMPQLPADLRAAFLKIDQ